MNDLTSRAIGPVPGQPGAEPTRPAAASPPADGADFRALLERLERLAGAPAPAEVHDTEGLQQALRAADQDFTSAMDLRRRLEDAFRSRQP